MIKPDANDSKYRTKNGKWNSRKWNNDNVKYKIMSNCSKHKKDLFGESDMKKVAEAIGDLHYETLAELLKQLFLKIGNDGKKDLEAGRIILGCRLLNAELALFNAYDKIRECWEISKPFMQKQ